MNASTTWFGHPLTRIQPSLPCRLLSAFCLILFHNICSASVPLDVVIDFDKTPKGTEISDNTIVDSLYSSYGVKFSSRGPSANGSVYARKYLPPGVTPDTRPNIQSLFKSPIATDFDDSYGQIIVTFSPPAASVALMVVPINEKGNPYLRAYDVFGKQIAQDARQGTPNMSHLLLKITGKTNRIARIEYSALKEGSTVIFDTLEIHRLSEEVIYSDPIWVDDDNISGYEDGSATFPFNTIAEAMNVAVTHTIRVRAGEYAEDVVMKDGVRLLGAGAVNTIIDGNNTAIQCTGIGSQSLIAGFTLTGAQLGILCTLSSLAIHDNVITNISGASTGSDGIRLDDSSPLIQNNLIYNVDGMGIRAQGTSAPHIINNTLYDYRYYAGISFAALNIGAVSPVILNNIVVRGNQEPVGGILWRLPATPVVAYNDVFDPADVTGTGGFYAVHDGASWHEASGGAGAISEDPLFIDETNGDFYLRPDSHCINAGDPASEYNDADGSRNDMGAYGGHPFNLGGSGHPGSGFLFTSIGKIPVTEIEQDDLSLVYGLVNVSATVANDFHIPQYVDSPLGGSLRIRGLFGASDPVDFYQIAARPISATISVPIDTPLSKVRFTINPDNTVTATTVPLGPQTIGGVPHLYELNKEGYWSDEDLRIIWNTAGLNGRYRLDYKAFQRTGPDSVVEVSLPPNTQDHLVVYLDNTPMELRINNVMYADHTNILECEEIKFPHGGNSQLIFNITAFHPTGFMNSYSLTCAWGHNHYGGSFTYDQYVGSHNAPPPYWQGLLDWEGPALQPVDSIGNPVPWENCTYAFHLSGGTRTTNGYWYLQSGTVTDLHSVETNPAKSATSQLNQSCADCPESVQASTESLVAPLPPLPAPDLQPASLKSLNKVVPGDTVWVDDDALGVEDGTELHPFNTIGEGIAAAVSGSQTVRVLPGTYHESVVMRDGVSVIGSGADSTIVDAGGASWGASCVGIGAGTVLVGFTFTQGSLGVYCNNSTLAIRENMITNMNYLSLAADGIRLDDSSPLIQNNVIHHVGGMGIRAQGNSEPRIINNTIRDYGYYAAISFAALNIGSVSPTIKNNIVVRGNSAPVGGILWKLPASPIIDYNNVFDPANVTGGGSYYAEHNGTWTEVPGGTGAISVDPEFVDVTQGNFHLAPGSPCIDTGDPDAIYNDTDGSRNDMGAYGGERLDPGISSHPGSGFIFTGIGNVPITEIVDAPANPSHGLLRVSDSAANSFHIPKYWDSPFGGYLWLHGLFGVSDDIDYYQILAAPYGTSATETLTDPLTKIQFSINPDGTVTSTRIQMGPQTVGGVPNVYLLNKSGYWTFTDLRFIWNTTGLNGKYSLSYRGYRQLGDGSLVEVPLPRNELDHFVIQINNTPVQARIENVTYADHTPIPECSKIILPHNGDSRLIFTITGWHPEGYLRYYLLNCTWGNNNFGGQFTYEQYLGSHDGAPPTWQGVLNFELPPLPPMDASWNPLPWHTCAYQFYMEASTRVTDGYSYLYWNSDRLYQSIVYSTETVDADGDGVTDVTEDHGPNGGDSNNDGIPDKEQPHVASLPNAVDGRFLTLMAAEGHVLKEVEVIDPLSLEDFLEGQEFPVGLIGFEIAGVDAGTDVTLEIVLSAGVQVESYYKYGPTQSETTPHWYEFLYDQVTGAEISTGKVLLHFRDGLRGDNDLLQNGVITEPGGPSRGSVLINYWKDY